MWNPQLRYVEVFWHKFSFYSSSCIVPDLHVKLFLSVPVFWILSKEVCGVLCFSLCSRAHHWWELWRSSLWVPIQIQWSLVSRVHPRPTCLGNKLVCYNIGFWRRPKEGLLPFTWHVIILNSFKLEWYLSLVSYFAGYWFSLSVTFSFVMKTSLFSIIKHMYCLNLTMYTFSCLNMLMSVLLLLNHMQQRGKPNGR